MKEQFVTYEITLILKELGFDEPCLAFYNYNNQLCGYMNPFQDWNSLNSQTLKNSQITVPNTYTAPLWQQVIDWFREKHDIYIDIYTIKESSDPHYYFNIFIKDDVMKLTNFKVFSNINYYYIREQAILKAIELCQKRK